MENFCFYLTVLEIGCNISSIISEVLHILTSLITMDADVFAWR